MGASQFAPEASNGVSASGVTSTSARNWTERWLALRWTTIDGDLPEGSPRYEEPLVWEKVSNSGLLSTGKNRGHSPPSFGGPQIVRGRGQLIGGLCDTGVRAMIYRADRFTRDLDVASAGVAVVSVVFTNVRSGPTARRAVGQDDRSIRRRRRIRGSRGGRGE